LVSPAAYVRVPTVTKQTAPLARTGEGQARCSAGGEYSHADHEAGILKDAKPVDGADSHAAFMDKCLTVETRDGSGKARCAYRSASFDGGDVNETEKSVILTTDGRLQGRYCERNTGGRA
jgi:hypothetical protein